MADIQELTSMARGEQLLPKRGICVAQDESSSAVLRLFVALRTACLLACSNPALLNARISQGVPLGLCICLQHLHVV